MAVSTGAAETWTRADGTASGEVTGIYTRRITKPIKGTDVIREASEDNPAYLIQQDDGDQVLKSASEIDAA